MRVLILHSRYMTGPVSGENRVVEDETRLLSEGGHTVDMWSPEPNEDTMGRLDYVRTGARAVWSRRAALVVRQRIREHRPDVIHIHNLYPMLSPTVARVAHAEGVPTVMSLHNFRLLCLSAILGRGGEMCELCVGHLPWAGVRYACYHGSRTASAVVATSLAVHRAAGTFGRISLFLPVSGSVRVKYIEAGFDPDRLLVKPNFAWDAPVRQGPGEYFVYAGRLSKEKGVARLLDAWNPSLGRLLVVGTGPEEEALRSQARGRVEFIGAVAPETVRGLLSRARALLVPSVGLETSGKVIMEAYASGVPVVASRIGALPEAVEDGSSGFLVTPGDPAGWRTALETLSDDSVSLRLGERASALWRERYAPATALAASEEAYRAAVRLAGTP